MNKREAELQRCLEKTLKDLKVALKFDGNSFNYSSITIEYRTIVLKAFNRITRTLRKGK